MIASSSLGAPPLLGWRPPPVPEGSRELAHRSALPACFSRKGGTARETFAAVHISARERFASNLRAARKARGLSQEALGALADLHPTYVGSVERGERNVSIDNMERLASALGVDVIDLLRTT
jgi:ribosome-binding protein aMBF1 (putative translation factor)